MKILALVVFALASTPSFEVVRWGTNADEARVHEYSALGDVLVYTFPGFSAEDVMIFLDGENVTDNATTLYTGDAEVVTVPLDGVSRGWHTLAFVNADGDRVEHRVNIHTGGVKINVKGGESRSGNQD